MPNVRYPAFESLGNGLPPPDRGGDFDSRISHIGDLITGGNGYRKPKTPAEQQQGKDSLLQQRNGSLDAESLRNSQLDRIMNTFRDNDVRGGDVWSPDWRGGSAASINRGRIADKGQLSQPQNPRYMDGFGNQMPASEQGDRMRLMDLGILGIGANNGALRYSIGGQVVPRGTIPQFARGGTMAQDGPAIVGEQGPELVNLPAGAQVTPIENADQYSRLGSRTDPSSRVGSELNPLVLTDRTLQGEIDKERNVPQEKRLYGPTTGLGQDYQTPNMADFLKGGLSLSEIMRKKYELEDQRNQIRDLQRNDATDSPEIDQATSRYDQLIPYLNELAQNMQGYVPGLTSSKQPGVVASIANRNNSGADLNRSRMGTEASKQYYYDAGGNLRDTQSDEIVTQSPHVSARTDAQAYNQNSQGDQHSAQASFIEDTTQPTVDKINAQGATEGAKQRNLDAGAYQKISLGDRTYALVPFEQAEKQSRTDLNDQRNMTEVGKQGVQDSVIDLNSARQGTEQSRAGNYDARTSETMQRTQGMQDRLLGELDLLDARTRGADAGTSRTIQQTRGMQEKLPLEKNKLTAEANRAGRNPTAPNSGMNANQYVTNLRGQLSDAIKQVQSLNAALADRTKRPRPGSAQESTLQRQQSEAIGEVKRLRQQLQSAMTGESNQAFGQLNQPVQSQQSAPASGFTVTTVRDKQTGELIQAKKFADGHLEAM